jgi:hypothetical protein
MEIVHAHIVTKPNVTAIDFQQKTKVNNLLQHIKPNPPKIFVITDLIYGKAIGSQKKFVI